MYIILFHMLTNFIETAEMTCLTEDNAIYQHGQIFAEHLGRGLADNWSQVLSLLIWKHHF